MLLVDFVGCCPVYHAHLGMSPQLPAGECETIPADLVLKSIGFKSVGIPGVAFDSRRGVIPNQAGQVGGRTVRSDARWMAAGQAAAARLGRGQAEQGRTGGGQGRQRWLGLGEQVAPRRLWRSGAEEHRRLDLAV